MKYVKPKPQACPRADDRAILNFLDSLPDEFEIVPEGHVCVKWPEGVTRVLLESHASDCVQLGCPWVTKSLGALAAIAPEKKRRRVALWEHKEGSQVWRSVDSGLVDGVQGWRKVGECEVDE